MCLLTLQQLHNSAIICTSVDVYYTTVACCRNRRLCPIQVPAQGPSQRLCATEHHVSLPQPASTFQVQHPGAGVVVVTVPSIHVPAQGPSQRVCAAEHHTSLPQPAATFQVQHPVGGDVGAGVMVVAAAVLVVIVVAVVVLVVIVVVGAGDGDGLGEGV